MMPVSSPSAEPPGRGGGWVAAQFVLFAGIVASTLVGLGWSDAWRVPALAATALLAAAGLLLVVGGAFGLGRGTMTAFPRPKESGSLAVGGLYSHARHPIYGGVLLLAAASSLGFASIPAAILTVALAFLFVLKSRREEAWLVDRYPAYAAYRRRVRRRFLPYVV